MNTNLCAAFEKVLKIAVDNDVPREEMPKSIIVISDMEIDYCGSRDWSFYDKMFHKFKTKGYDIPNIIFWNVNSRNNVFTQIRQKKAFNYAVGSLQRYLSSCLAVLDTRQLNLCRV